jgi:hypothetical protein
MSRSGEHSEGRGYSIEEDKYTQGTGRAAFVNLHTAAGLGTASAVIMTAHHNGAKGLVVRSTGDLEQLKEGIEAPEGVMVADCKVNPEVEGEYLREAFVAEA